MIRFIELGHQISYDVEEFAFFSTIDDKFIEINGSQVWESKLDFAEDCMKAGIDPDLVKRYLDLMVLNS